MKYCPHCGKELSAQTDFCPHCGKSFKSGSVIPNVSNRFWVILAGTVGVAIFALLNWVDAWFISFNLFSAWGGLNDIVRFLGSLQELEIVRVIIVTLSVLLITSFVLLIISLIRYQSKGQAKLSIIGFTLSALVSLVFVILVAAANDGFSGSGLTAFPFLVFAVSVVALVFCVVFSDAKSTSAQPIKRSAKMTIKRFEMILIALLVVVLLVIPHISGTATVTMVSRIMIFAVFAMAYDILRGYIGVIHLGFALFIGGGAYFVGILFRQFGVSIPILLVAVAGTTIYSAIWALIVGKISGKSGLLATAMITMAFSEIMRSLMTVWRTVTQGEDGIAFRVPAPFDNRMAMFYACLIFMAVMAFVLYKFTNSPTGRVWQAVRENEQRAIFLGYNTERARTIALLVASVTGGLAGVMFGLLTRFVNTDAMGMQMTYNAMLYSLLGGSGTLFGAILGSGVVILFQNLLLDLRGVHVIFDRWLLFFGGLYIVVVMFMPRGIMGFYFDWKEKRQQRKRLLG